ncbi:MAG: peptidase M3 [Sulfuricurvum sp. PC08-66]|nr:MAG: peptidase M3 [Sulfuricurvum sp. PC08-66]
MFLAFDTENLEGKVAQLEALLADNRARIEALLAQPLCTYANFIKPFELLEEYVEQFFTPLSHLNSVKNSELTQKVYAQMLPLLSDYSSDVSQDARIYGAFEAIKTHEYEHLNATQRRVIDESILAFQLSGVSLPKAQKERLKAISLRKSELSNDFSQNVLNATNAYALILEEEADVAGIPASDLSAAAFVEEGKTKYRFTLKMPSYIAYMTYGPNRAHREALYHAYTTRAPQNSAIIDELLRLRQEQAEILGFESYAHYSLATKMAPDPQTVIDFLERLATQSRPQGQKELETLRHFALATDGIELASYDTAYYAEKLRLRDYDMDEELYRPYFEQTRVLNGMFSFLEQLFGVRFEAAHDVALWDTKATAYDIYDHDELRARLYVDLEARDDKKGGAWMHNWQTHCTLVDGSTQLASAFIVGNFPPSSPENPSLLRHDDVVTLFHEMGHAIHHLFSRVEENGLSGVNGIEWDAVEFPSQFLENFAYEPQVLRLFARHYETDEILPPSMIETLVRAKNFQSAMAMLRQLEFGLFDFRLHSHLLQGEEVQALLDEVRREMGLLTPPRYNAFQNSFSHIFGGGYAAGYYSYKWAEVLSADAFYHFVDNGIFNEPIARGYFETILERGASASMRELFEDFMGRNVDTTALLRLNGIDV